MTACIVSGESLDSMGKPYVFDYDGREVQLCCKDCKKEFDKTPEEFMKVLDAEAAAKNAVGGAKGN